MPRGRKGIILWKKLRWRQPRLLYDEFGAMNFPDDHRIAALKVLCTTDCKAKLTVNDTVNQSDIPVATTGIPFLAQTSQTVKQVH